MTVTQPPVDSSFLVDVMYSESWRIGGRPNRQKDHSVFELFSEQILFRVSQVALQCSEVVQAGLANVFQGPLMDVLKKALQEPHKVGLCLFGGAP